MPRGVKRWIHVEITSTEPNDLPSMFALADEYVKAALKNEGDEVTVENKERGTIYVIVKKQL